ncbi:MAG: PASTA domain-containing protein [Candidatus Margulisiibacteriota bacterium]
MLTNYLSFYLIFVIVVSLLVSGLVLRLKLPSPRSLITVIMLFILSPLLIGYVYTVYFDSLPETMVPDVTGLTLEVAKVKLESGQLRARVAGTVFEIKKAEGTIVSQRPEAGRTAKVGRVVNLMISSGREKVNVPSLLGRTLAQADAILTPAQLQIGDIRFEQSTALQEGTILAQEPLSGEQAEMGGRVDLLVATSQEVVTEERTEETE